MSYLLDTNTVIDYLGGKLPATAMTKMNNIINAGPAISVINKIEVLGKAKIRVFRLLKYQGASSEAPCKAYKSYVFRKTANLIQHLI